MSDKRARLAIVDLDPRSETFPDLPDTMAEGVRGGAVAGDSYSLGDMARDALGPKKPKVQIIVVVTPCN